MPAGARSSSSDENSDEKGRREERPHGGTAPPFWPPPRERYGQLAAASCVKFVCVDVITFGVSTLSLTQRARELVEQPPGSQVVVTVCVLALSNVSVCMSVSVPSSRSQR